jgi:hypothetical protein
MPYYHCRKCHHEFEFIPITGNETPFCDWCNADKPIMLEEKTPLEKLAENADVLLERLEKQGDS